jgi:serine/threonine-protein kinase HipA
VTELLDLWLYGTLMGSLEYDAKRQRMSVRYYQDALERFGLASPILSASLPLRREPYPNALTRDFFDGLLPEGDTRALIARDLGETNDTFSLMRALGRDCAGALVVQPADEEPPPSAAQLDAARPLAQSDVATRLAALPQTPLGVDNEVRLSLAGIQQKLVLTRLADGSWALPVGGVPSTHILKPQIPNPQWPETVQNEAYCMRLARHAGLNVASIELEDFGDGPVLVVERFDRAVQDGKVKRLHQEDGCQALGKPPQVKYQENGGPTFKQLAALLIRYDRNHDLPALLAQATFNVAVGNADAHGKNYSFSHPEDGSLSLTPAYDLMCTMVYPLSLTMGMAVDEVRRLDRTTADRLINEAIGWGLGASIAHGVVRDTLLAIAANIDAVAEEVPVDSRILHVIRTQTESLSAPLA